MFDAQAIIAEATAVAPEQVAETAPPAAQEEIAPEAPKEQEAQEDKSEDKGLEFKPDSELTPEQLAKRESNRLSHLKSRSAKQARELRELREFKAQQLQMQQQPPAQAKPTDDGRPKEADYEEYNKFIIDTAKFELRQELKAESEKTTQKSQVDNTKAERIQQISQMHQEFVQRTPEYKTLAAEYGEFLGNMPPALEEALFDAENPVLATYVLMKEGKLYDLEGMPAHKVAMEIGRAEERGRNYLGSAKKATSVSAPIESLKGTGRATKDLDSMSVEDLMKKFNR